MPSLRRSGQRITHRQCLRHHMDDDLETFFLNFSRGTGLKGLTGIHPKNGSLHRPLLPFTREQIYRYAQDRGYTWREDQSNQQDYYQRNYIRHHVVPGLKGLERPWDKSLKTTQAHLSQAEILVGDYLNHVMDQVIEATEDGLVLDLNRLSQWPNDSSLLSGLLLRFGLNAGRCHCFIQSKRAPVVYREPCAFKGPRSDFNQSTRGHTRERAN